MGRERGGLNKVGDDVGCSVLWVEEEDGENEGLEGRVVGIEMRFVWVVCRARRIRDGD